MSTFAATPTQSMQGIFKPTAYGYSTPMWDPSENWQMYHCPATYENAFPHRPDQYHGEETLASWLSPPPHRPSQPYRNRDRGIQHTRSTGCIAGTASNKSPLGSLTANITFPAARFSLDNFWAASSAPVLSKVDPETKDRPLLDDILAKNEIDEVFPRVSFEDVAASLNQPFDTGIPNDLFWDPNEYDPGLPRKWGDLDDPDVKSYDLFQSTATCRTSGCQDEDKTVLQNNRRSKAKSVPQTDFVLPSSVVADATAAIQCTALPHLQSNDEFTLTAYDGCVRPSDTIVDYNTLEQPQYLDLAESQSTRARHDVPISSLPPSSLPVAASADNPTWPDMMQPVPYNSSQRDQMLLSLRRQGFSYREIKEKCKFREAESTLRGRYRMLTKPKQDRLRKPQWSSRALDLLEQHVNRFMAGNFVPLPQLDASSGPEDVTSPYFRALEKVPWKQVAENMEKDGCYRYGNSTVKKKFYAMKGFLQRKNQAWPS